MTGTAVRSREAQQYLDGVAAELADLADEDRADLLDELAAHLDELAAESDAPLPARLGTPAEYAAELRASAGLPPARARGRAGGRVLDRLRALERRRDVTATRDFLVALRPAWWVLRAWVLVGLVAMWPGQTTPTWSWDWPMVPRVASPRVGLLVLVAVIVLSVQLGRGRVRSRLLAGPVVASANVLLALLTLPVVSSFADHGGARYVYVPAEPVTRVPADGVYADGSQVWNIYPYDAGGRLLHDVRLYDQDGAPLSLGLGPDGTRKPVVDSLGRLVANAFPYRYVEPDGTVADPDAGPPVDAPALVGVPTPSATPSPSPAAGKR